MPSVDDATALQEVLGQLSTLTQSDLVQLFRKWSDHPDFSQILVSAFPEMVGPYLEASALVSAQMYDEFGTGSAFAARPVADIPAERMNGTLSWALNAPGVASPLDRIAGAAQRMVFDASRNTMMHNLADEYQVPLEEVRQSAGTLWARHASLTACSFCRIMATRGAVYRSESSAQGVVGRSTDLTLADRRQIAAGLTNRDEALARREKYENPRAATKVGKQVGDAKNAALRGNQKRGSRYHDHCRCVAVPVRPGESYEPAPYVEKWQQDYQAAVGAAKAAGQTKGEYGAIDLNAVVRQMDGQQRAERKAVGEWLDAENAHNAKVLDWLDAEDEHKHAVAYYSRPDALAEAWGETVAKPKAAKAPKRTVDDALADMQAAVAAGNYDAVDKFAAEAEKLEARAAAAAAKQAAKEAAKSAAEQAKIDRMLELIDREGWQPDEAEAEAYGITVEKVRRQNFIRNARADGHVGRGFDELIGWKHQELASEAYFQAEAATNGRMLKRKYEGTGKYDARQLWTMSDAKVREVASEEMLAWFDQHGRLTRSALRSAVLDGTTLWRNPMGEDFLQ